MSWSEEWKAFRNSLLNPWSVALFAVTVVLGIAQALAEGLLLATTLVVLIGVCTGVIGSRIERSYSRTAEGRILISRGRTAIRGLGLLIGEVQALEQRVKGFHTRLGSEQYQGDMSAVIVGTYLEEVIGKCNTLQKQSLSSIEDWKDIIPEADIPTQISIVTEFKADRATLLVEQRQMRERLIKIEGAKDESETEVRRLRDGIADKEREMSKLSRQLLKADSLLVGQRALVSGSYGVGFDPPSILFHGGGEAEMKFAGGMTTLGSGVVQNRNCPICGTELDGSFCLECQQFSG